MAFIDGSALTVVMPILKSDLDAELSTIQWVVNGYVLVLASLALTGGAMADTVGKVRVLALGCLLFGGASVACALAPSIGWLIVGRIFQGVGAAGLLPASLAVIGATFSGSERYRALSTWAAASALTTAAGPVVGGWLADHFGWRAIFWMNPPLALVSIAILIVFAQMDRPVRRHLDLFGATLLTASLGAIVWSIGWIQPSAHGTAVGGAAGAVRAALPVITGVAGLILYGYWERASAHPMTPPYLARNTVFVGLNLATLMNYAGLSIMFFLLPFELRDRWAMSLTDTGLIFLPFTLGVGLLSRTFGRLAGRVGARDMLIAGSTGAALAYLWMMLGGFTSFVVGVILPMTLLGLSYAVLVVPLSASVMSSVRASDEGLASGVNNAASRIAQLLGVVIATKLGALATGYEIGLALSATTSFMAAVIIGAMIPQTPRES
jgi:MFS family permease